MKPTQIAGSRNEDGDTVWLVLMDDGSLWVLQRNWAHDEWQYVWDRVDIDVGDMV